jgi:hypothetical protein
VAVPLVPPPLPPLADALDPPLPLPPLADALDPPLPLPPLADAPPRLPPVAVVPLPLLLPQPSVTAKRPTMIKLLGLLMNTPVVNSGRFVRPVRAAS